MENAKEDNAESRQWIRDNAPALMSLGLQGFALHGKGAVFADPFRKYNPCYVPAWLLPPHQDTKTAVEKYSPESEIVVMLGCWGATEQKTRLRDLGHVLHRV
jgi:hypothetical protein